MAQSPFPQVFTGLLGFKRIFLKLRYYFYFNPSNDCELTYIPTNLLRFGRNDFNKFYIGEYLYFRCKEEVKNNPFDAISLVDLSHNRSGRWFNIFSIPNDVLLNTNPTIEKPEEKFDLSIACLEIKELINRTYVKELREPEVSGGEILSQTKCVIQLKHKPINCNYSHCAFEFYFNDEEVTFKNYGTTLGSKANKKLRTRCKHEISKMIIKEEVRINF